MYTIIKILTLTVINEHMKINHVSVVYFKQIYNIIQNMINRETHHTQYSTLSKLSIIITTAFSFSTLKNIWCRNKLHPEIANKFL